MMAAGFASPAFAPVGPEGLALLDPGRLALLDPGLLALLNPGLLALGAGLIAVPILIHLLNRRRVQHTPWAAMQWLLAAVKRHQRRMRIENWLILALRVLAVLLLGLALARPVLTDPNLAGLFAERRSVYLVVDTSYSMAARSSGRSVMDLAKAEADAVLSGLGSEDTVAVLVTNDPRPTRSDGRAPFVLVPRSGAGDAATRAKESIATLRTRDAPANWADTLDRLRQQTAEEDVNRVVILLTDLQARDWRDERVARGLAALLELPSTVRIVDVGPEERRNLTVAGVRSALRRDAFVGRPVRIEATVENQGDVAVSGARLGVFLDGDPTPLSSLALPPLPAVDAATGRPGTESVVIQLPGREFEDAGSHVLRVEVTPPAGDPAADGLGLDSRRDFAVRVRDRIRVLVWARRSDRAPLDAATYLRGVYERFDLDDDGNRVELNPLYEMRTVEGDVALADALGRTTGDVIDLVVLANVTPRGPSVDALRAFVRGGGALLAFVGDQVHDPAALNDPFHADAAQRLLPFPIEAAETRAPNTDAEPFTFDLSTPSDHPLARPFTNEEAARWIRLVQPALWGRMTFREVPAEPARVGDESESGAHEGRVILRFDDGRPAIVEGGLGLGRSLWIGTSVDQGWFERALPFFLPVFLDEAAVYLTRPDEARRNLEVGRRIVVTWLPRDASGATFVSPGGAEWTPTRYDGFGERDRPTLIQDRVGTAGTWRLSYEHEGPTGGVQSETELFAVNPDAGEGRLLRARDAEILAAAPQGTDLAILRSWEDAREDAEAITQGEIAPLVLWIALGLLVLELVLAWQFGRRGRPAGSAGANENVGVGVDSDGDATEEAGAAARAGAVAGGTR